MKTEIKWYVHQRRGALPVSDRGNALAKPDRNIQKNKSPWTYSCGDRERKD